MSTPAADSRRSQARPEPRPEVTIRYLYLMCGTEVNSCYQRDANEKALQAYPGRHLQVGVGQAQVPGDQDPLDPVGSLPDLQHLGVPVVPGHRELLDVSVRAVDLEGIPGAVHGDLAGVKLGQGSLGFIRTSL